ncbi:MAG: transposase [Pseudorhodobacter sp.]
MTLLGARGPWLLCLDRTNWQIGAKHVNVLVLALVTRRHRVPLMWRMLDGPGNSPTATRIALMERYLALFGAGSVKMLLADREFIGGEWLRYLHEKSIPFTIRLRENMTVITEDGEQCQLRTPLQTRPVAHAAAEPCEPGGMRCAGLERGLASPR